MTSLLRTTFQKTFAISGQRSSSSDAFAACAGIAQPEVQDAQRFINEDKTFGPLVQTVMAPGSASLSSASFDGAFVFVAVANVTLDSAWTADKLQHLSRYTRLELKPDVNCIFLRHLKNLWTARIAAPAASVCSAEAATSATDLSVLYQPVDVCDTIPNAARIIEGKSYMPYIGVRCGNAWCVIGAKSADELLDRSFAGALSGKHAPPATSHTRLDAWFDEQMLAVMNETTKQLAPGFRAAIVPDTGLIKRASAEYDKGFVLVSWVYAAIDPPKKYAARFGYTRGWNMILMHRDGNAWSAMIVDAHDNVHVRLIMNYPHTVGDAPGSARWDWWDGDEWVWAPCDAGCCLVQEGDDT